MDEDSLPEERSSMSVQQYVTEIVDRLVRHFDPEQVILFGSRARGDAEPESDFDLLVVMNYEGSARDTRLAIRRILADIPVAKDIVVTTPEEFAWRKQVAGTLEHPAAEEGKVLYARPGKSDSGSEGMGAKGRK